MLGLSIALALNSFLTEYDYVYHWPSHTYLYGNATSDSQLDGNEHTVSYSGGQKHVHCNISWNLVSSNVTGTSDEGAAGPPPELPQWSAECKPLGVQTVPYTDTKTYSTMNIGASYYYELSFQAVSRNEAYEKFEAGTTNYVGYIDRYGKKYNNYTGKVEFGFGGGGP